jgi:thiol-disulfide isomerase/thioredoxin
MAFVRLMVPNKSTVTLIAEPNKEYNVIFDLTKDDDSENFKIQGPSEKAQELYNQLPVPEHIQVAASPFLKDSIESQIQAKIASLKEQDLSKFKDLLAKDSISQSMYDFIELDRGYYYGAVQGTISFIKLLMNERKKGVFTEAIKNMWANTFDNDLLTRPDFQKTDWGYALAENYLFYQGYKQASFDVQKFRNSLTNIFYPKKILENAEKLLPTHNLEYFKAIYLYTELLQKDYQKEFITLYDEFKSTYPNSSYSQYLEPLIAPVVDFHKKAEQPFAKDIKFVENYGKITDFNDLLSHFKGKKLYLDIWGTWCGPCKVEFQHKSALNALLKSKDVDILYICEGRNSKEEVWKNMIKFYGLDGQHLMANEALLTDIFKIFGNDGSFYYPRYILIDENGKTIKSVAAKPSELETLKAQLTEMESL